jgi:hypothetical protein
MTEYANADSQKSANLAKQANSEFEKGISMRETGDKYVKVTVFLATVLLLTALAQRFEIFGPRAVVVAVTFVLLFVSAYWILTFVIRDTLHHSKVDLAMNVYDRASEEDIRAGLRVVSKHLYQAICYQPLRSSLRAAGARCKSCGCNKRW